MQTANFTKKQLQDELWRRGVLVNYCHSVQREMYNTFYSSDKNSTLVWLLARQSGKSYLLAILALEQALRQKNSIIKVVTDTKLHMNSIFIPIMNELLEKCPEDVKPQYSKKDYTYIFSNGSQIQLAGSDGKNYEKLRGQKSALCLVDESGFCNDLSEMVKSVLIPTTTHTGGRVVLASTPPPDYDHDFIKFIEDAELKGLLSKKTIYDNPLLTKEAVTRIENEMGGVHSEQFRREYLCELIKDSNRAVIPEANAELMAKIVKEVPRPIFYDAYVSMDLGFNDLTVVLFGYFDFKNDQLVIEDEIVMEGKEKDFSIKNLGDAILHKETALWFNVMTNEQKIPYKRVSDINHIVTNEIRVNTNYQVNFTNADKYDNNAAINNMRAMLGGEKIIISPKCTTLVRHLLNVKWKGSQKLEFARSPDDGHYDAVDALKYMCRAIANPRNPYPPGYNLKKQDLFIKDVDKYAAADPMHVYKKIFGQKKR